MSRLGGSRAVAVTLFPFLNILVCTLSVLVLIGGTISAFGLDQTGIVVVTGKVVEVDAQHGKRATYVEWDGSELLLHPRRRAVAMRVDRFTLDSNVSIGTASHRVARQVRGTAFQRLVECMRAEQHRRYLVFLVRPSGFDTFIPLREYVLSQGLTIGYEAIGQHVRLEPSGTPCG